MEGAPQFLIRRCTGSIVNIDLQQFLRDVPCFLKHLYRWRIAACHKTICEKPLRLCDEASGSDTLALPAPVSDAVLVEPGPLAVVPIRVANDLQSSALSQLHFKGISSKDIEFKDLDGVDMSVIDSLVARGIVRQYQTEFMESRLALVHDRVLQTPAFVGTDSLQAFRVLQSGDPFRLPKLYHIFKLLERGWSANDAPPAAYTKDGPCICSQAVAQPVSYFVALGIADFIFSKGAREIKHGERDVYYKALIRLPPNKLLKALEDLPAKGLPWLQLEVRKHSGKAIDDGSSSDGDGPRELVPLVPGGNEGGDAIAPFVLHEREHWSLTEWQRCIVQIGDLSTRVWFDNCSDTSGKRRGWSNCHVHGCGCIRFCQDSRDFFATAHLLWLKHGIDNGPMTRAEHLA